MIAAHRQSITSTIRTITLLAAMTSLLLTMVTPFVGVADATLAGSTFNGADGVIPHPGATELLDPCPTGNDSEDPVVAAGADDGPYNGDSTKLGVIHTDPVPTINPDINHPGKSDLCKVWIDSEVVGTDMFLYLAWEREATSGSTIVFYEFHQQALTCTTAEPTCNPFAPRTVGDLLLTFDFQGNAVTIYQRVWNGSAFGPVTELTDPDLGYAEGSLEPGSKRGEAVINLADAGILDPTSQVCKAFAGVIPGTVTGNSDTADYKDVVLSSNQPNISNCGSVVVNKQVVDSEGTALGTDYGDTFPVTLTDGGALDRTENLGDGESFTQTNVFQGDGYTVSEDLTGLDGWSVHSISCTNGTVADDTSVSDGSTSLSGITVAADATTTCTVKNTPDLPTLKLEKTVVNNWGGEAQEDAFTPSIDGGEVEWDTAYEIAPGAHTASEEWSVSGYTAGEWDGHCEPDGSLTVDAVLGGEYVCTITNSDTPGGLRLVKVVEDPDGLYPDVDQDDFDPLVDGNDTIPAHEVDSEVLQAAQDVEWYTAEPDNTLVVPAGEYTPGEDDTTGPLADGRFFQESIECADGNDDAIASVPMGGTVTCTITNVAVGAGLTLVKNVTNAWGGALEAGNFTLRVDGEAVTQGDTSATFPAGTYDISEDGQDGYDLVRVTCTEIVDDQQVTILDETDPAELADLVIEDLVVGAGDTVVCTFYNEDRPGELTVVKDVVNDDGGTATEDDFTSDVDFTVATDGEVAAGNEPDTSPAWGATETVPQGTYVVGEGTIEDGYALTGVACYDAGDIGQDGSPVDGAQALDAGEATATVALSYDDDIVCIVTNDDQPSQLTLVKKVVNDDGGVATQDDFDPTLAYEGADGDYTAPAEPTWTSYDVPAGTFTIGEVVADGYDLTGISCVRGDATEPFVSTGEGDTSLDVDVLLGDDVTCTVVNDDQPATLILDKDVINDDGGTAVKSDFTPTIEYLGLDGATPATSSEVPSEPTWNTEANPEYTVPAGDYTIGELIAAGYLQVGIECTVDGEQVDGATTASFTLGNGETADCLVTNDDIAPGLTVVKQVVNDDGGTLTAAEFPLQVTDDEGTTTVVETEVENFVAAGTYTVDELQQAGYELTSLSCVRLDGEGETPVGDLGEDGASIVVTLGLDETVICTIVNDDIAPTVVLRKTVVNDDGGTLSQDDFPVTFDDGEATWDETITTTAGEHTAAETTQPGYVASDWGGDCAADGSLTTDIGETYECAITNDDVPAGLTVVKEVVNDDGGTAEVGDFPLTVTPEGEASVTVTSGVQTFVAAGTYTISEEQQPGYALDSISCDNGVASTGDDVEVTVGLDEAVICTVVNDDLPIGIQVIKTPDVEEVTFDADGEDQLVTYSYTVTNTGETTLTDLSLFDDVLGDIELPVDELVPNQTVFGEATHLVTAADAAAGTIVNVAVVEGTSPDDRTTDDDDDAEVAVNEVEVLPDVITKPPAAPKPAVLAVTGLDTMRLALFAALIAGLGVMLLLGMDELPRARRRRAQG